jgi:hypothetical protein
MPRLSQAHDVGIDWITAHRYNLGIYAHDRGDDL